MTTMEIKREALEMDEMELVSGGTTWWLPVKKDAEGMRYGWYDGPKNRTLYERSPRPNATYLVEFDKYDIEYMEDYMTPQEIYEYFNYND